MSVISEEIAKEILSEQKVAALALITPNGLPHNTPVWITANESKFYVFTRLSRAKAKYAKLNENCMIAFQWASVRGKVKVLTENDNGFFKLRDLMDERYGSETGYQEYKVNWDAALEITPTKLFR